jgi:hypothetical protein
MAEAVIAFAGLAASLVTLVAVVNDSCKTVHEIWGFYKEAPKLLVQVRDNLDLIRALLVAIESASRSRGSQIVSKELQRLWQKTKKQMERDFKDLQTEFQKLIGSGRVKFYFAQDRLGRIQSRICKHIETLQLIKSLAIR